MSAALDDLLVVDFTTMMSGPYCTRMLADLGADVVKVEPPAGDPMRLMTPRRGGRSRYFGALNCGKRSVVLDLRTETGRAAALALAAAADVVVENSRPGVTDRLGIGYEACRSRRPDVIYCSVSGFGQDGPDATRAAYAAVVHAASGYDTAVLEYAPDVHAPVPCGVPVGDALAGALAFGGIMTALHERARTGTGRHVDVSMLESMLSVLPQELQFAQFGRRQTPTAFKPLRASDGWVLAAIVTEPNWIALTQALGMPELLSDPRFAEPAGRYVNDAELHAVVEGWAAARTAAEAEAAHLSAGVPASRYRTMDEQLTDEHLQARDSLRRVHDDSGEFIVSPTPFRLDGMATPPAGARVPDLGEHTREVLASVAGYDGPGLEALLA